MNNDNRPLTPDEESEFQYFLESVKNVSAYNMLDVLARIITENNFKTVEECLAVIDDIKVDLEQYLDPEWIECECEGECECEIVDISGGRKNNEHNK